jgi:hypothetical protein
MLRGENPSIALAEKRRTKIINYIKQNPKTTKNNLVNYMTDNGSSLMTTHKILKDLERREIIKVEKPNTQVNYLTINDQNEFNIISNKLQDIENMIDDMDQNLLTIYKAQKDVDSKMLPRNVFMDELSARFTSPFLMCINTILRVLLVRIHNKITDEEYANTLNAKIVNLMLRVDKFMIYLKPIKVLDSWIFDMRQLSNDLPTHERNLQKFAQKNGIDVRLLKPIADKIENFKEYFTDDVGFPI